MRGSMKLMMMSCFATRWMMLRALQRVCCRRRFRLRDAFVRAGERYARARHVRASTWACAVARIPGADMCEPM